MPALFHVAETPVAPETGTENANSWRALLKTGLLYFAASLDPGLMPELLERETSRSSRKPAARRKSATAS